VEFAQRLDVKSPSNCSLYLRQLAKYGFVEEAEGGAGRRRPWRVVTIGTRFTDVREDTGTALAAGQQRRRGNGRLLHRGAGAPVTAGFSYTVLGSGQSALLATLRPPRRAG
jgi:hypothetical protein